MEKEEESKEVWRDDMTHLQVRGVNEQTNERRYERTKQPISQPSNRTQAN